MSNEFCVRRWKAEQYVARDREHTRRTETALQRMTGMEVLPNQLHDLIVAKSFKGLNGTAIAHNGETYAGARDLAVDQNGAGATRSMFAAQMGGGEPPTLTEKIGQSLTRFNLARDFIAIQVDG